ncbi:MAG: exodeoxyribonuclease III [Alphaproteobacteria bacterium]|nr:exodeoxyribonuclease III [Alphaproteobacteria bacterium]
MRIVTWNINSVRLRMPIVEKLTNEVSPDVICLQETKVHDDQFPFKDVQDLGYAHVAINGIKGYNGVCILSKLPLSNIGSHTWTGKADGRHIFATLPNGVEVHSLYVPAGGDEPDREINDKFGHKLDFVDEMAAWFGQNRKATDKIMVMGDLNIAPLEHDVWSHKQLLKIVSHTPIEVEKFNAAQAAFGWVDCMRKFVPDEEKLYTWWSYRSKDWRVANKGRRLDHAWATPALADQVTGMQVLSDARDWEKPSDHVPVILDFAG